MDSERFVIHRTLGAGGMGVVYEAHDRALSATVALKALKAIGPAALYRFKREFRALSDLSHENLVTLYELFSVGNEWFFTMELVRGKTFLQHVRGEEGDPDTDVDDTLPTGPPGSDSTPPASAGPPPDPELLRPALRQLATGLSALHRAGRLHRDIKPSNVLVANDGRVVICDFGLVTEPEHERTEASRQHVLGTASYMSPEQAAGLPLGEASDWYSVGVVLYQALTGELPFGGEARRVLVEKQMREPIPPSVRSPGVPRDLDELCVRLLRMQPEERPSGAEVLAALGARPPGVTRAHGAPFVGRARELAELRTAFEEACEGRPVVVSIRGASGIGKSALARHFLDEIASESGALVLSGRCYERESVPFKALDSLVDGLSNQLRRMPEAEVERILPADVHALTRIFPVLRRVNAIAEAPPSFEVPDPQESRRRASVALRELVVALASLRPLVLHLDDLQWGDSDSGPLIADLMREPDGPRALLVATYRDEPGTALSVAAQHTIELGALSDAEARELAQSLIGRADGAGEVARESGGNPMFVHELARWIETRSASAAMSLDDVIAARVRELPPPAHAVLGTLAIAGRPLGLSVLRHAAGLESGEYAALSLLRAEKLVRSRRAFHDEELEPSHDRVREAVVASLAPEEQRRFHARLVVALETSGHADPEALVEHLIGSGQSERAGKQAEAAGDHAARLLAFERAARLHQLALELGAFAPPDRSRIRTKLGDALVSAGRGVDAAQAYRSALDGANPTDALELRRRIAEQLLRSGHLDAGLDAVHEVLAQVGMELAATPRRALASLALGRARIRMRGLGFRERDASELSRAELTRIDACWSVATAVGMTDFIRGADFQTRHLLLALDAGEPHRVARGLAVETAYSGGAGGPMRRRTSDLERRTRELSARLGSPHLDGLSATVAGIAAFLQGRFADARTRCEHGEAIFRERCTGVAWELASAQFFGLGARYYLGELAELVRRVPERLREAEERGDLYRATGLRSWRTNALWLALDDPTTARFHVDEAIRRWTRRGFHLQHYYEIFSLCQIDLYTGDAATAHRRISEGFPELRRSMLLRIQNVRVEALFLLARAALARPGSAHLADAERAAGKIASENMAWSNPYVHAIRAGIARKRGDLAKAGHELAAAARGFSEADMALFAASARRALGALRGDAALVRECDVWMTAQSIRAPERMASMLVGGF